MLINMVGRCRCLVSQLTKDYIAVIFYSIENKDINLFF